MDRARFRRLVKEAIATLPPQILRRVDNVSIVIERRPSRQDLLEAGVDDGGTLLGLYTGIPLTERGENYFLVLPDKITLYQEPIEWACRTDAEIREQVRITVLHELAHYFGIDDERLAELGLG